MGKMHETRYVEGQRINNHFTLIRNFMYTTPSNKKEWRWECKCDCGEIFTSRENQIPNRYGCISCTHKKSGMETAQKKAKGLKHVGLINRLLKDYKAGAVKRNYEFTLTFDDFVKLLAGNCAYCGSEPEVHEYEKQYMQVLEEPYKHNGIDRIDPNKGYTLENCVSCCSKCNYAKHEMTLSEYKEWLIKSYKHLISSSSTIPEGSTSQANGDGNGVIPTEAIQGM